MGRVPKLDEVIAIRKAHEDFFRAKGVTHLAVFGSVARGDATEDSDVDLVIDIDPGAKFGLWDLSSVEHASADLLGRKVDVVMRRSVKPRLIPNIEKDAVDVFCV